MNMFRTTGAKSPGEYISLLDEPRKSEIRTIHRFIRTHAPKLKPYIQHGMIGYGKMPYKSKSGREGDWFVLGLASQKNYISVYSCAITGGKYLAEIYKDRLGKASVGKSCIRYRKFEEIPWETLGKLIRESAAIALSRGIFAS